MSLFKELASNRFGYSIIYLSILIIGFFTTCSNPSSSRDNSDNVTPIQTFPPASPEEVGINQTDLDAIWNVIVNWFEAGEMPGAELLIIKDRHTVFHNSIGWKDELEETQFENGTICQIMSMTKPFISAAIMQLVDEEFLNLDDRASDFIDTFQNTDKHNITIRQLLQHTAGFSSPGFTGFGSEFQTLGELINAISVMPLNSPPGIVYNYSTASVASLAYIISIITGIRSDIYISRNIFNPLHMDKSFINYDIDDYRNPIISSYYICDLSPVGFYIESWSPGNPLDYSVFTGSSGAFGSTIDYAKFLVSWSDALAGIDNTIISQESALLALQPSQQSLDANFPYGFLMFTYDRNDPNGIPFFGHTGVGGTSAGVFPDEEIIFVYFSQCRGTERRFQIANLIIDSLNL